MYLCVSLLIWRLMTNFFVLSSFLKEISMVLYIFMSVNLFCITNDKFASTKLPNENQKEKISRY